MTMNQRSGTMPRTRASFVGLRLAGAGWWVFENGRGTVVEPYRPSLALALSRVRMGEVVLDAGAARKIVDTTAREAGTLAAARDSVRRFPGEAVDTGLRFKLDYYPGWRGLYASEIEGALAASRRSLASGQWESLPDWDAKVMDEMASKLDELMALAKKTDALAPPPAPPPGAGGPGRPPAGPGGTGIAARIDALPAPAKVGLGIGAGAILIGLGYAVFG
jgi:hypothetical protein